MPKDLAHIEAVGQRHPLKHEMINIQMPEGCTITEIVQKLDLETERYGIPMVTMVRGGEMSVVPLNMWGKTRPKLGTDIQVTFPKRDPGSIALIASLAIPQAATAIAGSAALGLTVGSLAYSLVVAAVTIVGTLLVQALIPPAKTEGASGVQNYAITGTANAANPYGVFPTVLGRHRIYPPLTATGFSENAGQDVYYYGRMTFGYGPLALEDLRIGTTPITEFAAAEVELEFRNVDRDLTLAAMPGLAPFVVDRTGEENKPRFKLTEVGKTWTYAPRAVADQVTIEFNVSAQDKISGYTFIVEEAVAGSGTWAQVASFTLQDPVTNHDPLSGLQETRTFTSASYSDGVEREYRVTLTGSTPRTGEYTDNWLTFFSGKGVDAVTITKATATYHEVQPGWRYGTDSMFLYPEDITQDDENALPEPGAPVVRYTREASSAASVDISFSRGLYDGTDDGLESHDASFAIYYQPVAGGIVEEDWVLVASPTYEAKSTTALRYTVPMSFPEPAQYAIKIERTSGIDYSTRDQNRAWVTAIRSMTGEPLPSPEGIAEVAFKIKASDQLNGRLDSLNGIVQQLAPVWDGSAWTDPQPVRHPAWLYAQALRGPQQRRPVADSRLDLDAIKAWADQEPHWTCDYVIDTPTQTAEVLDVICAAGRARRTLSDFRWSVIRDGAAGPVRQTFTPRNSWGYKAQLAFPREIHGFRVKARSERLEWEEDEILVLKDGFTRETATELETLQLAGTVVTADDEDEGNAYRLGRYHLAVAENRPETHTFFADWEHIRVQRGDKIRLVHDVPLIGVGAARIKAITEDGSGNVATITLDELFDFERDSFRLAVRNVQAEVVFQALSPEDPRTRVWTPEVQVLAADIAVGDLVAIEETEQVSAEMLVTGIYPRKDESAKITCVDAVPAILQADTGTIPTYSPIVTNPRERADYGLPPAPVVISAYSDRTTQSIEQNGAVTPRISVQFAPVLARQNLSGAGVQMRWRESVAGAAWAYGERVDLGAQTILTGGLIEGAEYEVQVVATSATGRGRGWVSAGLVIAASDAPNPPKIDATFSATAISDESGAARRPAISLTWLPVSQGVRAVAWQVRVPGREAIAGKALDVAEGAASISAGILPLATYECRASFLTGAGAYEWGDWQTITTSDVRLGAADIANGAIDEARLSAALSARLDEAEADANQALLDAAAAAQDAAVVQGNLDQAVLDLTGDYTAAEQAADDAEAARDAAQLARDSAAAHLANAEAAQGLAEDAQQAAELAGDSAAVDAADAETARQLADSARIAAESAEGDAQAAATLSAEQYNLTVSVARGLLPSTFKDGGVYWKHSLSGDPSAGGFGNSWSFKQAADGVFVAWTSATGANRHLGPYDYVPLTEGRRYRMTITARLTGFGGADLLRMQWRGVNADFSGGSPITASNLTFPVAGEWSQGVVEFTYTGSTVYEYAHPFVYVASGDVAAGAELQVRRFLVEDVTEEYNAGQSASAAATSEAEASAYADDAGESASAAQSASVSASTSAGNASTSATDAAASESSAAGSASTAVTAADTATSAANDAGDSADAAASSASAASSSATGASQSASAANTSATNAATSAGQASTSAQQASASETNAAGSASAASSSAGVAANSASDAGDSADAASTSASAASTSASDASQSASAANTSATNAATSAGEASTSAGQASTSASNAAGSANSASNFATAAANSASDAGDSADAASSSASAASTSASGASQSASAASSSANTASTKAGEASTSASNAAASESSAAGSATAAQISETVAARTVAENAHPVGFDEDGKFFSHAITGDPALKGDLMVGFRDTDEGRAAYVAVSETGNRHCVPKYYLRTSPGRRFRLTIIARHTGAFGDQDANAPLHLQFRRISSDYTSNGDSWTTACRFSALNVFETFTAEFTDGDALSPYMCGFAFWAGGYDGTSGNVDIAYLAFEDITSEHEAAQSAAAASTSQSSAAASESAASQSASAAQTSASNASTSAGNASSSATAAANSASSAASAANSASASERIAAITQKSSGTRNLVLQPDGNDGVDLWTCGAGGPNTNASVPSAAAAGDLSIRLNDGARVDPHYRGNFNGRKWKMSAWVRTTGTAAISRFALRGSTTGGNAVNSVGAVEFPANAGWAFYEEIIEVSHDTQELAPGFDLTDGGSIVVYDVQCRDVTEEESAADSAEAASVSASSAQSYRDSASSSASSASSSANTATTRAGDALTYRNEAAASRDAAGGSADAASRDAAGGSADAAADSAVAAAVSEQTAARITAQGMGCIEDPLFALFGEAGSTWGAFVNGPTSESANEIFPSGKTLTFNRTDYTLNEGLVLTNGNGWSGPVNEPAYVVEVVFTFVGGTGLGGAGVLIDWNHDSGESRTQFSLESMINGTLRAGQVCYASKVFKRPAGFPGNFTNHDVWFMSSYSSLGARERKHLKVHRFQIRPARADETEFLEVAATVDEDTQTLATLDGKAQAAKGIAVTATSGGNSYVSEIRQTSFADPDGSGGSLIQLRADSVLVDGTLTTGKLAVGYGGNLLTNTGFWAGLRDWSMGAVGAAGAETVYAVRPKGASFAGDVYPTLFMRQQGSEASGYSDLVHSPVNDESGAGASGVPITPGQTYEASIFASMHRCSGELRIKWIDGDGNTISYTGHEDIPVGSGSSNNPNTWQRIVKRGVAPSNAARAQLHIRKLPTNAGQSDSYLFLHKPMLCETVPNATEITPYSPGGATFIDGGQLISDTVDTRHMRAGSITAASGILGEAAVQKANIGDAQVDTLQIAGNAVVVPVHAQFGSVTQISSFSTWVSGVAYVNIERVAGLPTQVSFGGQLAGIPPFVRFGDGAVAGFRVIRNGVVIAQNLAHCSGFKGSRSTFSFTVQDNDRSGGVVRYAIQAIRISSTRNDKTPQIIMPWMRATQYKR
ncbi:host specificity factor TipJ family phage tail protein [Salipiger bermudensis]|uniref:Tail fiber protein, putative n=1 Tax=Salipiger bermudensis (strain DSM 26914 / JCM 13377 / KCTC 12554 / HTCC2601) TaxID=314265 RepID=Q0FLN4_SALBH|nr:host specificity factor TipJ family phage tail protein [Salipiger bermudensis]EAU45064.1 tail fiber protein, putative [Salipiger bermudensis HTCC2601]